MAGELPPAAPAAYRFVPVPLTSAVFAFTTPLENKVNVVLLLPFAPPSHVVKEALLDAPVLTHAVVKLLF